MAISYTQLFSSLLDRRQQVYNAELQAREQKAGLAGSIGQMAGMAAGAALGSIIPGLGTAVGASVGSSLGASLGKSAAGGNVTPQEMMSYAGNIGQAFMAKYETDANNATRKEIAGQDAISEMNRQAIGGSREMFLDPEGTMAGVYSAVGSAPPGMEAKANVKMPWGSLSVSKADDPDGIEGMGSTFSRDDYQSALAIYRTGAPIKWGDQLIGPDRYDDYMRALVARYHVPPEILEQAGGEYSTIPGQQYDLFGIDWLARDDPDRLLTPFDASYSGGGAAVAGMPSIDRSMGATGRIRQLRGAGASDPLGIR